MAFRNLADYGNNLYIDNINITGTGTPVAPTASFTSTPTSATCTGQTVQYTSTSTGTPTTYTWSFSGGTPATSSAQNPTVTYATAGTYNVSLTVTNSIGTNTSNQTNYITVNATPSAPTATAADRCGNGTVTLGATASAGTLSWFAAATGGTALGTGTSFTTLSISTTTTYYVSSTASGCSSARTPVVATINPTPTVTNPGNKTFCIDEPSTAISFAGSSSSSTYAWTNSNTAIGLNASGNGNITSFTPSTLGTSTISVTPTLNGCPGTTVSFTITVVECNVGIDENDTELIIIYPNPTSCLLTIKDIPLDKVKELELVDTAGKKVGNWKVDNAIFNVDIIAYANGSYNLIFKGEDVQLMIRLEIKK